MNDIQNQVFICFSAKDRYSIAEPLVFHLKNYGINVWYDRQRLIMGDNRVDKNLVEGAMACQYAVAVISTNTANSKCAMEELRIIEDRYRSDDVIVFPVLYEIAPKDVPTELCWIKELIFKETNKNSGTREICNHIACRITDNIKQKYAFQSIKDIIGYRNTKLSPTTYIMLCKYTEIDNVNLNSRVTMLYAAYLTTIEKLKTTCDDILLIQCIFERLFCETRLNLVVDYRELWLLENAICILLSYIAAI